jgi:hypothetical protein
VRPDLDAWGFNSVGWTQEVVTRGLSNHRHSRAFTWEEYQWLGLPDCHQLPFANFHQWEMETKNPQLDSPEFADWCDYVAREHCARMQDDPKLIGYFYLDCPTWIHTPPGTEWKGPMFDPPGQRSHLAAIRHAGPSLPWCRFPWSWRSCSSCWNTTCPPANNCTTSPAA